jgi:hypothetical protein
MVVLLKLNFNKRVMLNSAPEPEALVKETKMRKKKEKVLSY